MTSIQIECFLAAARTGRISSAGDELFLSVQAVSKHILSLEKELGMTLFLRGHDGVRLTEDGQDFLRFASRWSGLYTSTMTTIRERYRNLARRFRIGISEYVDPLGEIGSGLASFAEEHADVDIRGAQYVNRELMQAVADGTIDVAIMADSQVAFGGDYEIVPFAAEDLRLYISHVPELPETFSVDDVARSVKNVPQMDASYGPWSPEEWGEISRRMSERLGFVTEDRHTFGSFRSVVASVRSTRCMAVSDARFGYLHESDTIRSVPLRSAFRLCCVSDRKNENPLTRSFAEHLKKYYKQVFPSPG